MLRHSPPRIGGIEAVRRSRRVICLLLGIVLLSAGDLVATITHLQTIGMVEANPIARWLIDTTRSPWALAVYKIASVSICVTLLYRLRHHAQGEIAAWTGALILMALVVYWGIYAEAAVQAHTLVFVHYPEARPDHWIILAGHGE